MATFKDKAGRTWAVELDFDTADRIAAQMEIDLIDPQKLDRAFIAVAYDPRKLRDLVWFLCESQAGRDGRTREDFSREIGPAQLGPMLEAVQEAIADFSPRPELAEAKRRAFRAIVEVAAEGAPLVIERNLSTAKASARQAMNSPESSAPPTSAG